MKLYLISQGEIYGYDTYDSAVVSAPDEQTAINMHPSSGEQVQWEARSNYCWAKDPKDVSCKYLGETTEPKGVICASFNAG